MHLFHKGDNPFSNDLMKKFEGKHCKVSGEYDEKKQRLLILQISEIEEAPKEIKLKKNDKDE